MKYYSSENDIQDEVVYFNFPWASIQNRNRTIKKNIDIYSMTINLTDFVKIETDLFQHSFKNYIK